MIFNQIFSKCLALLLAVCFASALQSQTESVRTTTSGNRKIQSFDLLRLQQELNALFAVTDLTAADVTSLTSALNGLTWADVLSVGSTANTSISLGDHDLNAVGTATINLVLADSLVVTKVINGQVSSLANHTADDLAGGDTNQFFTLTRSRNAITISDTGGDGSLTYDASTGAITYTGPSASEFRAHFSAGTGVSLTDGEIAIGQTVGTTDDVTFNSVTADLTGDVTGTVSSLSNHDSDDLTEGASNLYYSDARSRGAISVTDNGGDGSLSYDSSTGAISYDGPSAAETRAHFSEGTGVTLTDGEIAIGQSVGMTDDVTFNSVTAALTGDVTGTVSDISDHDSDDLTEGASNLYFTEGRSRSSISVTDNGGDGSLSYDSSTGAITYDGPSAAEARAHFSEGTGVTLTDGEIAIGQAVGTTDDVTFNSVTADLTGDVTGTVSSLTNHDSDDLTEGASNLYYSDARSRGAISVTDNGGDGSLSYDSSTGAITYDGPSAAETRAHFSEGTGVTLTDGEIAIGQAVGTTDDVTFNSVTADLTGDVTGTVSSLTNHDSDDLTEGASNLYYSDARSRGAISVTDNGGDGALSYDSSTGTITFDGPSAAEVRAHFSTGTGVTLTDGEVAIGQSVGMTDDVTFNSVTADLTGDVTGTVSSLTNHDSDDLTEGASNLYYSDARSRGAISVTDNGGDGSLSYNSSTGAITYDGPSSAETRAHFSEGTGVTLTDGEIAIGQAVGTADDVTFNSVTSDLTGDVTGTVSDISNHDSDDLAEGASNLYYSDARSRGAISVTDNGGDGSLGYDSSTGAITFEGPSAAEVRAHFSAGTGVTLTDGDVAIGQAVGTADDVTFNSVTADLTGDVTGTVSSLANQTTDSLTEGAVNLYFTAERKANLRGAIDALKVGAESLEAELSVPVVTTDSVVKDAGEILLYGGAQPGYLNGVDSAGFIVSSSPEVVGGDTVWSTGFAGTGSFSADVSSQISIYSTHYFAAIASNSFAASMGGIMSIAPFNCGTDAIRYNGDTYATVVIGSQCWFADNLQTSAYANGDIIPTNLSDAQWAATIDGAQAPAGGNESQVDAYGRLYNYHAVKDNRGLCPSGWHIPSDAEWRTLEAHLGMPSNQLVAAGWRNVGAAGEGLKSQATDNPAWDGTNAFGFYGEPGGARVGASGSFAGLGSKGYWWSAPNCETDAWVRSLAMDSLGVERSLAPDLVSGTEGNPTGYEVTSIPFNLPYPLDAGSVAISTGDDVYSGTIPIGFAFNFFGCNYEEVRVSSNGWFSFDLNETASYRPRAPIPDDDLPFNSVMLTYNDLKPSNCGDIRYATYGTAPNRKFVISLNDVCHYSSSCSGQVVASQAVLSEGTNEIEIFIQNYQECGEAAIGIQDATGAVGLAAPGYNTGYWDAMNVAFRFSSVEKDQNGLAVRCLRD